MSGSVENILIKLIDEHSEYQNKQDVQGVLSIHHSQSLTYASTQQFLSQLFLTYKLKNTVMKKTFLTLCDGFAYIRVQQRIEKIKGPEFVNNISDSLVAFKKENGEWKIWNQMALSVNEF